MGWLLLVVIYFLNLVLDDQSMTGGATRRLARHVSSSSTR
jgi:hypothetical protein